MALKYVLISGNSRAEALAKVSSYGGSVGMEISSGIFVASVLDTWNENQEDAVTTWLENTASEYEKAAWEALQAATGVTTIERPVPFSKTGKTAIALLIVNGKDDDNTLTASEIGKEIIPGMWEGAQSLVLSYPDDDIELTYDFHNITISPSSKVPNAGITAWPSAVPFQDKLYTFFEGKGPNLGKLMYDVFDPSTEAWEGVSAVSDTTITEGPSAVVFNNMLYVFHSGSASEHEIWYNIFDGTSWAGDVSIYNTRITGGPSVVEYDGKLYCFHQGYTDNNNEFWYNVYDGTSWVGDKLVTDTLITESPSAVVFEDKIFCFYQGVGDLINTLLVNRFDPTTEVWSGPVNVPYTESITKGPSALAFDDKIYVFHMSGDEGGLWFNTSTDGSLWRGDTPLTHMQSTDGLGTTVFGDELYCFYQGVDTQVESIMYRSFAKGSLEWEDVWSAPALESLGYASYAELAEAVRVEHEADYGYVVCFTKLPLLYNSYADETRLCIQYPTSDDIGTTFAKIFDATAVYDRTSEASGDPRYTFALTSAEDNTVAMTTYATGFVFHQGAGTNSGTQLYFSLLDRRSGSWTEMQGPVTSSTTGGQNAAVFLSNSKLYVFYQVDQNGGELYYNILDGVTWQGETKVPDITGASGSPGAVLYNDKIYCFYQFGSNENGKFFYNALDPTSDTWQGETELALQTTATDPNFGCYMTLGPSPAVFLSNVYNLYNGAVTTSQDNGVYRDGRLRVNEFDGSTSISDMQVPNTYLTGEPSAVVFNSILYSFHQGSKSDGTVWYNTTNGVDFWDGDKEFTLANGLLISDGPSAMALESKLYCFLRGKGTGFADILFYNVLDESNAWGEQQVVPTGSGIGGQHAALAIGSLCITYDTTPPTVERII